MCHGTNFYAALMGEKNCEEFPTAWRDCLQRWKDSDVARKEVTVDRISAPVVPRKTSRIPEVLKARANSVRPLRCCGGHDLNQIDYTAARYRTSGSSAPGSSKWPLKPVET